MEKDSIMTIFNPGRNRKGEIWMTSENNIFVVEHSHEIYSRHSIIWLLHSNDKLIGQTDYFHEFRTANWDSNIGWIQIL